MRIKKEKERREEDVITTVDYRLIAIMLLYTSYNNVIKKISFLQQIREIII